MPKKYETKSKVSQAYPFEDYFKLPNNGLRSYFGSVVKGQPEVYETPFAEGESTQELLDSWKSVLVAISDRFPGLWEFEIDLADKVGPMSVRLPLAERLEDIDHYYEDIHLSSTSIRSDALNRTIADWNSARGLRMRSISETVKNMKLSTNSGSPFFAKRRNVLAETLPVYVSIWNATPEYPATVYQSFNNGYTKPWLACAVLGWRGQEGGYSKEDVKQRVVWMFPFGVNIRELQVYQPLIESAQRFNIVPAWVSMDAVDRNITKLFATKRRSDPVVCTDFTKFDQHFNLELQNAAEYLLKHILTENFDSRLWFDDVFKIKYMIPLAYDWDRIRYGDHGMASGSGGTNADETLVHMALQHEAAINDGQILNPYSMCLGDDGILSYRGITSDKVVDSYVKHGLEMNPDKQMESTTDCVYLRRWHSSEYKLNGVCAGVYSTCRALGRMRYTERFYHPDVWDKRAVALRHRIYWKTLSFIQCGNNLQNFA